MNRNARPLVILFAFILFTITSLASLPTTRSTVGAVDAASQRRIDQADNSTEQAQSNDVPAVQPTDVPPPTTQPTDVPPPTVQSTDIPTTVPTPVPTDIPTTVPTDIPTDAPTTFPTDIPTTVPTDVPTDVPTTQATDVSTTAQPASAPVATDTTVPPNTQSTDVPTAPETTDVPTAQPTTIDSTEEPTAEATAIETEESTEDLEATEMLTPEVTETPDASAQIQVTFTCAPTGVTFVITNNGDDMTKPAPYKLALDDSVGSATQEAAIDPTATDNVPEFTLHAGESLNLDAGFGRPSLAIYTAFYQPDAPCVQPTPPVLAVTTVCTLEKGVTFTVTNSGGAMLAAQDFTITVTTGDPITNSFQLDTNAQASFDAGYGQPTFTSGDLVSTVDTSCDAPATISGVVWNDADGDGTQGASETGIAGVTVEVINATNTVTTSVTGADGSYTFDMLAAGTYTVKVDATTLSTDYRLSYPTDAGTDGSVMLVAAEAGKYIADFGFVGKPTASVTGTVWLETSNYGVHDPGEMGIAGVVVDLVDHTGTVVAVAPVDGVTGTYLFSNIYAGDYTVQLDQTTLFHPNAVTYNSDGKSDYETPVTLKTDQALTGIDFGIVGTF